MARREEEPIVGPIFARNMTRFSQSLAMVAGLLVLAGCERQAPSGPAPSPAAAGAEELAPGSAPLSHASETVPAVPAPVASSLAERPAGDSRPPDLVLRQWGTAIERRDWAAVRALWGHGGADSGVSARHFAAGWDRLRHPVVSIGKGSQEGAAGSLYYSAPVTITDGAHRIAGTVTIRRANDVPGATPEQLRWHADATTRAPWTTLR